MMTDGVDMQNTDIKVMNTLLSFHCRVHEVPYDSTTQDPQPLSGMLDQTLAQKYGNTMEYFVYAFRLRAEIKRINKLRPESTHQ